MEGYLKVPPEGIGEVSDGYHTFNELYHHRAILFATLCHSNRDHAWKTLKHVDGTMFEGMFVVGMSLPTGEVSYHFDVDPYWDLFDVPELPQVPFFDGYTSEDVLERLYNFGLEVRDGNYD